MRAAVASKTALEPSARPAALQTPAACQRLEQQRISIAAPNPPLPPPPLPPLPAGAVLLLLAGPASAADSCIQQLGRVPGATTKWVDPDTPPEACAVQMCTDNSYEVCSPTDPAATAPQTLMQARRQGCRLRGYSLHAVRQHGCSIVFMQWLQLTVQFRVTAPHPPAPLRQHSFFALPLALLQLVFSDEFNSPGRKMGVGAGDPRWTADNLWYLGTFDEEVYTPEQVGGLHHKASKRSILLKGH